MFHIALQPTRIAEHRNATLAAADGEVVRLVREHRPGLWVTDRAVPDWDGVGTDYVVDGFLCVFLEQDGTFFPEPRRVRR